MAGGLNPLDRRADRRVSWQLVTLQCRNCLRELSRSCGLRLEILPRGRLSRSNPGRNCDEHRGSAQVVTEGQVVIRTRYCIGEWVGDLPLVEKVVASELAKITCPRSRFYIQVNNFRLAVNRPALRGPEISKPRCSLSALACFGRLTDRARIFRTLRGLQPW